MYCYVNVYWTACKCTCIHVYVHTCVTMAWYTPCCSPTTNTESVRSERSTYVGDSIAKVSLVVPTHDAHPTENCATLAVSVCLWTRGELPFGGTMWLSVTRWPLNFCKSRTWPTWQNGEKVGYSSVLRLKMSQVLSGQQAIHEYIYMHYSCYRLSALQLFERR